MLDPSAKRIYMLFCFALIGLLSFLGLILMTIVWGINHIRFV